MIKYCLEKWDANRDKLLEALANHPNLRDVEYEDLFKMVVHYILNDGETLGRYYSEKWSEDRITVIDDGCYRGTLLFLVPRFGLADTYLMTYIEYGSFEYGSRSRCDALENAKVYYYSDEGPMECIKAIHSICKDMITNMIKPFNDGWRYDEDFATVEMNDSEEV